MILTMNQAIPSINRKTFFHQLFNYLHRADYHKIKKFPLRKYPIQKGTLINEFAICSRYILCRNNIFSISLYPPMYQYFSFNRKLIELRKAFFLNEISKKECFNLIQEDWLEQAVESGLLQRVNEEHFRFLYRIVPYRNFLLITSRFDRNNPAFTYLSFDSIFFAEFLEEQIKKQAISGKTALDICCGVGILAFVMSRYFDETCGLDLNPSSVHLAQMNAELNGIKNCQFINESIRNIPKKQFDLITANPPFIHYPQKTAGPLDSDGGEPYGLGVTLEIIQQLPELLNVNGRAFVLTRSPFVKGNDLLFCKLSNLLPEEFSWTYHDLSDSVGPLVAFEAENGIESYHHVIVEIIRDNLNQRRRMTYPFFYRKVHLF